MHISRLMLDSRSRTTREVRLKPYLLHQAVYRAFPDEGDGGPGRVLYRMDTDRAGNTNLLVQSEKEPDWGRAVLLRDCIIEPIASKPISFAFRQGQALYFRLRANPTVKRATRDQPDTTRRLGLFREEEQLGWLARKARNGGFGIMTCRTASEGMQHDDRGKRDKLRHFAVIFEGTLRIADPELFETTVGSGIGPAKAFGFGMLSVAPLKG